MKHQTISTDGKYTIQFDNKTGKLSALRYNEPWRDLSGDGMVLSMLQDITDLKEQRQKLIDICFELVSVATSKLGVETMPHDKQMEWVATQLAQCGFKTEPCGASWGLLKDQK